MSNYDHKYEYKNMYFGPYIYHCKLDPKFCEDLLDQGELTTEKYLQEDGTYTNQIIKDSLAGDLAVGNERQFNGEQQRWFRKSLDEVFRHYISERMNFHNYTFIPDYIIENAWINYQHANEYQPEHTHSGDFSWVIYLQIPRGMKQERENYKKKGPGPGCIAFSYGETSGNPDVTFPWVTNIHMAVPEENEMYIFPSQLKHSVPPFKCNGTRISVSGNGVFQRPDSKLYHMGEKRYEIV